MAAFMETPAIQIKNLSVEFGGRVLFKAFNADIYSGRRVLIAGPSGSGKSTLLRCLLGFTIPKEGEIFFNGIRLDGKSVWQLRKEMAYVPQEPIFKSSTVLDALKTPFGYKSNSHLQWNQRETDSLIERFGLGANILTAKTDEISGGEKQRIAIIGALLLGRSFMFMDEPTSALDASSKAVFTELFTAQRRFTVVFVSHDEKNAAIADASIDIKQYI